MGVAAETEERETGFGSFPRGAAALLGLLNYVSTRVGGAKQEESVSAPVPDEPEPEESADVDRVAAMPHAPKLRKPSPAELALRAKQMERKKAFDARRSVYEVAGHRHLHLRWWRETDSWRSFESTRDGFVSTTERLEVREAREARFYEVIPQPPPTEAPPQPSDGTTTDQVMALPLPQPQPLPLPPFLLLPLTLPLFLTLPLTSDPATDQEWVQLRRAARRATVEAAVRERREIERKDDQSAEDQASRVAEELIREEEEQHGHSAALASQCRLGSAPSSALVPPQGASCASGQLGAPRKRPTHWTPSHRLGFSS